MLRTILGALAASLLLVTTAAAAPHAGPAFQDRYAVNHGVRIHYMAAGKGPLVVMLHGFPEYWGFYRGLMTTLDGEYRVAAVDLRGYNLSDKPKGEDAYTFDKLVGDVAAVIKAEGRTSAIVVGHDWGAAIAWRVAMDRPELVDKLVIMSVPHPAGFAHELATDPQQQKNSQYARNFQIPGFEANLKPEQLTAHAPPEIRAEWTQALRRSDMTALLNYYRANYPKAQPGETPRYEEAPPMPPIRAPVLVIHGVKDQSLLAPGHNSTWEHVNADTTILMLPNAGHDVQHDAPALVNGTIRQWLELRR